MIELVEKGSDPAATTFGWSILLVCGDPKDPGTYFGGSDRSQVGPIVRDDFVLISVQHPGDLDDASPEKPASTWPDGPGTQPRPSVVAIRRVGEGGRPGKIGA